MKYVKTPPRHQLARFGLSQDDWEEYLEFCEGTCLICQRRFTPSRQPVKDHDHATGEFRGLLCNFCNQQLGFLHENAEWLARASAWLTSPPTRDLWPGEPRRHVNAPPITEEEDAANEQ